MSKLDSSTRSSGYLARSKGRLRWGLGLACFASLTLGAPAHVEAEEPVDLLEGECDDAEELPLLEAGWWAAQLDCGVEALKDGFKDAIKSKLKALAMDLVAAGVNAYLPGIGSMLFSSGDDPFAAHVDRILDRIDLAEENIIAAIWHMHEREANLTIEQVKTNLRMMADDELHVKVAQSERYRETLDALRLRLTDLTWPKESDDGNLSFLKTEDLPKLHSIAVLGSLLVNVIPETAVLEQTSAWSWAKGRPFFELTDADRFEIQKLAEQQTRDELEDLLTVTIVPYLTALNNLELFQTASDERFSSIKRPPRPTMAPDGVNCPRTEDLSYRVEGIGSYHHVWTPDNVCPQPQMRQPVNCTSYYICIDEAPGNLAFTSPFGTVTHRAANRAEMLEFVDEAYVLEKEQQYSDYLRRTYGAVHPMLTSWGDLVPGAIPALTIDTHLDRAVMPFVRFNSYYLMRFDGNQMVDIGNGSSTSKSDASLSYEVFLMTVGDPELRTDRDRRYAIDRVLSYGPPSLSALFAAALVHDGMGLEHSMSLSRPILKVEPERDATEDDRRDAATAFYKAQFGAKFAATM
jgi:hypothetical protein